MACFDMYDTRGMCSQISGNLFECLRGENGREREGLNTAYHVQFEDIVRLNFIGSNRE